MILGLAVARRVRVAPSVAAAPVNLALPVIRGIPEVGQTMLCGAGEWSGSPFPALSFQWLRDGVDLLGATAMGYEPTVFDAEHEVSCRVTGTNVAGSASATSAAVTIPAAPEELPANIMTAGGEPMTAGGDYLTAGA